MGKKKSIHLEVKKNVIELVGKGEKQSVIARKLNIDQSTVSKIAKHQRLNGFVANHKPSSGRPRITSDRDERIIVRVLKSNRFSTIKELKDSLEQRGVYASNTTLRRRLKKNDFQYRTAKKKPALTMIQKRKRVQWAKKYISKSQSFWEKVVFSDESTFTVPVGRQGKVWRKKGEEFNPDCIVRKVKHPGSIMVWGCISKNGMGDLQFIKGGINSTVYQGILEKGRIQIKRGSFLKKNMIFQQDGASCHTSSSTKNWFTKHKIDLLPWCANSPDANPIENVWRDIKFSINKEKNLPRDINSLKTLIEKVWKNYPVQKLTKLYESMPKRCQEIIKQKGHPTKY